MPSAHPAPLRIGAVALRVRDLDAVARFYVEAIGLRVLAREGDLLRLGVGATPLIELRRAADAPPPAPGAAGLYHTAFLLPDRADLACWLGAARARRLAISGAADHAVSEAVYLADPEGNGVEVYADRPRAAWRWEDGQVEMRSGPLAVADLLALAGDRPFDGAPPGTTIGHVHLRVGAIDAAERFYGDALGLAVTRRRAGATFFASGGYHHHLAANVWESRGAGSRGTGDLGLAAFELVAADEGAAAALRERLRAAGVEAAEGAAGLTVEDPWRNRIVLRTDA